MRFLFYPLMLAMTVSCCKTIKKPEPGFRPLTEQVSPGKCVISFSPEVLGSEGSIVELTVADIYYGIFLITNSDYITVPCATGDVAIFQIDRADGTLLKQRSEVILPPKV